MPYTDPDWQKAIHEEGAVSNVIYSAVLVFLLSILILLLADRIAKLKPRKPLSPRQQYSRLFIACILIILCGIIFKLPILVVPPLLIMLFGLIGFFIPVIKEPEQEGTTVADTDRYLAYNGEDLNFSFAMLTEILNKRFPFFKTLRPFEKQRFLVRLRSFIQHKLFVIHDTSGFKEMPVLVSASAVQLSFGLQTYLMPVFREIHIYPDEFISTYNGLHVVIGNVSNKCINISWKHFLDGFEVPENGVNVGLHEMAHAYYYQNFAARNDIDVQFMKGYSQLEKICSAAIEEKQTGYSALFSAYGLSTKEEFWAESVELFFEKPYEMKQHLPQLFAALETILNQTPTMSHN